MRFNPNSGHWEKDAADYAEEKRRWDEGTARLTERDKRREARKTIGKAACVCWDYETPDVECSCGAY